MKQMTAFTKTIKKMILELEKKDKESSVTDYEPLNINEMKHE